LELLNHLAMVLSHLLRELLDRRALRLLLGELGQLNFRFVLCQ